MHTFPQTSCGGFPLILPKICDPSCGLSVKCRTGALYQLVNATNKKGETTVKHEICTSQKGGTGTIIVGSKIILLCEETKQM